MLERFQQVLRDLGYNQDSHLQIHLIIHWHFNHPTCHVSHSKTRTYTSQYAHYIKVLRFHVFYRDLRLPFISGVGIQFSESSFWSRRSCSPVSCASASCGWRSLHKTKQCDRETEMTCWMCNYSHRWLLRMIKSNFIGWRILEQNAEFRSFRNQGQTYRRGREERRWLHPVLRTRLLLSFHT